MMSGTVDVRRLSAGDAELAVSVFSMMASVFGEDFDTPSRAYIARLLNRSDFWAIAALEDAEPVGGVTAFVLPSTRSEKAELFIYDVAVLPTQQRRGIGRRLLETTRNLAAEAGMVTIWVPAENDDVHALEFYKAVGGGPTPATIFTFRSKR
jgi:aminoglycoside 3-N-acetyltransferase I